MIRVSAIWLGVAAICFAVAIVLTVMVTSVSGRLPIGDEPYQPGQPIQVLGIFADDPTVDLARDIAVFYDESRSGDAARIKMFFPAGSRPVVIMNGLSSPKACASTRTSDEYAENQAIGGGLNIEGTMLGDDLYGSELALVVPAPSDFNYDVTCTVTKVSRPRTFTSRALRWYAVNASEPFVDRPAQLDGMAPLPATIVGFGAIVGAEDFRFSNGFEMPELNDFETKRAVPPGGFVTVTWNDIFQQQFRDILLIVIGTMIGIGVTVAIEGLRPLIERQAVRPIGSARAELSETTLPD